MKQKMLLWILLFPILAACGGTPPADPATLTDTTWVLQELRGQAPLPGSTITLELAADMLGGTAGCNRYGGPYTAQQGRLTIGQTWMTLMYCLDPAGVMEQEQDYLAALAAVASYRTTAGRLELLDDAGQVVVAFVPAPPQPTAALEGPTWELTTWLDGEAASSVLGGTTITLHLEQGNASGTAGCNSYTGPYTRQGHTLHIGAVTQTEMYCLDPTGVMEQEGRYLSLLPHVTRFEIDGDQLTLWTADGTGLVWRAR